MNEGYRLLVTDEPVEVLNIRKTNHRFRGIYGIYLQINKGKTRKIRTCNRLPVGPLFKIEVFNALQNTPLSKQSFKNTTPY